MRSLRDEELSWRHDITAVAAFITRDNINGLLTDNGFAGDIGLLSIDIDGNDYWVMEAIDVVSPCILICEYNAVLGDRHAITVPYQADFDRLRAHHSGQYFGASITAIRALAARKGYSFAGTCSNGVNAFFVRNDAFGAISDRIAHKRAFVSRHRDSRDEAGALTHVGGVRRSELIADMPVVLVEGEPRTVPLGSLGSLYSDGWLAEMEG